MVPLGWIPVSTVAFAVVAFAFGSRALLRNLLFGAVLAGVTFVLFNYGLGLPASGRQRRRGAAVASARLGSGRVGWRP